MTQIIIANVITIIAYGIDYFFIYKYKNKATILKGNMASSSLNILSCFLLGGKAGVISGAITLARIITIYFKDKYKLKLYPLFFLFCGLYLLVLREQSGLPVILLCISNYCIFIPKWFSINMQHIRIGEIICNILCIPYELLIQNYAKIPIHILSIMIIIISFIKWTKSQTKNKEN